MHDYNLQSFLGDISINHEFEFYYLDKMYSLSYSEEEYIFRSYNDLLNSVRIENLSIEEIIDKKLYND